MAIQIRRGTSVDAAEAVATLRRSIAELCVDDHRNDPQEIAGWLGNKTSATWNSWVARDDAVVLVAESTGEIVGVGMADLRGEVLLNYVHPEARFSGISKAILAALEDEIRAHGGRKSRLESTVTARLFYERNGYRAEQCSTLLLCKAL